MVRLVEQPKNGVSLLEQYRASGSPDVFAQIMRAYGGMVFSVCLKVTKDPADAEDASQAVFLTLAVQCKTGAVIRYLGPWLKKVAKRSSLDLVRSRKRRSRREAITAERRSEHYTTLPGERSEQTELQEIIRAELDHLPAKYRMPLVLHYFGGLSHDEISREMRCTTAALGVRLHRARKMLGKRLSSRGVTLEGVALTAALSTLVTYCVNEQFVQTTTQAMVAMQYGRPSVLGAVALGAHVPASLGVVPQLMQEIAQSMARARLRYATLAMAISITFLGGAAEAVRHLPDSIRPSLEFLSPSKAIERFFGSPAIPRMQSAPPVRQPTVVVQLPDIPEPEEVDTTYDIAPVVPAPTVRQHQPVLAMQLPTLTPPVSTHTPHLTNVKPLVQTPPAPAKPQQVQVSSSRVLPHPAPLGSTARTQPEETLRPTSAASNSSDSPDPAPAPITVAPTPRDPNARELSTYIPPPSELRGPSANLERIKGVQTVTMMQGADGSTQYLYVDGSTGQTYTAMGEFTAAGMSGSAGTVSGTPLARAVTGPRRLDFSSITNGEHTLVTSEMVSNQLKSWLVLKPNDLYIFGDRQYAWSDRAHGINPDAANSVQLSLDGVVGHGVFSVERLATNTTLAPERPKGHTFIGIWSANTLLQYEGIDLTVRYDEVLAQSLGLKENVLKLWVYDGESWIRIVGGSFVRDMQKHTLSGSFDGKIYYFGVSAPEPSVIGVLGVAAGALLRRQRRQTR